MTALSEFNFSEREMKMAANVITHGVYELRAAQRLEGYTSDECGHEQTRKGIAYGKHDAAIDICGSYLSALFDCMGVDANEALEALAKQDVQMLDFSHHIVGMYYDLLLKIRAA